MSFSLNGHVSSLLVVFAATLVGVTGLTPEPAEATSSSYCASQQIRAVGNDLRCRASDESRLIRGRASRADRCDQSLERNADRLGSSRHACDVADTEQTAALNSCVVRALADNIGTNGDASGARDAIRDCGYVCPPQDFECLKTTPQQTSGWTYNDVLSEGAHQQLFCKMQRTSTASRSTTGGPRLISENYVAGGLGLSNNQFGASSSYVEGQIACGMCIKATLKDSATKNFSDMNCELTHFSPPDSTNELVFMVTDQCTDPGCVAPDSWLDLDNYGAGANQMVMEDYTWTAVECPVDGPSGSTLPITLAFNQFAINSKFALTVFDSRVPVTSVEFACEAIGGGWQSMPYQSSIGYTNFSQPGCAAEGDLEFKLENVYGEAITWTVLGGLHGGTGGQDFQYLVPTTVQFMARDSAEAPALYPSQTFGSACTEP